MADYVVLPDGGISWGPDLEAAGGVMRWRKGSFRVAINARATMAAGDNGWRTGYVSACGTWGVNWSLSGSWYATHVASGLLVAEAKKLETARSRAAALSALAIDWSREHVSFLTDAARDEMQALAVSWRKVAS